MTRSDLRVSVHSMLLMSIVLTAPRSSIQRARCRIKAMTRGLWVGGK